MGPDSCVLWPAPRQSHSCPYPPDSCSRDVPVCRLWSSRWNRDRWSTPDPARTPALPLPADTGARYGAPGLPPPTALAEYDSPWLRSLPRSYHPPTNAGPVPDPPLHTAARSAQTTAQNNFDL